jgi:hypothetical protein
MADNTGGTGKGKKAAPKIPAPGRDLGGRFLKGASANPRGRPLENDELKKLARQQGSAAIVRLTQLMYSDDEQVAHAAAKTLLDRGYGRPEQSIALDGNVTVNRDGPMIEISDPLQAAQIYQEIMRPDSVIDPARVTFTSVHKATLLAAIAAPRPRPQVFEPAGKPVDVRFTTRPHPQEVVEVPTAPPVADNNALSPAIEAEAAHIHIPSADAECGVCRRAWFAQYERPAARVT